MKSWITKHQLLLKDAFFASMFCLILTYILSLIVLNFSFLNPFKEAFKDFSFSDIYYSEKINNEDINGDIILINIEDKSRLELAFLLASILEANPKVVGVDAIFKDIKSLEVDTLLAQQLSNKKVVHAFSIEKNQVTTNHSIFSNGNNSGFVNFNFDFSTNVIRTFEGLKSNLNKIDTSFALQIAKLSGKKIDFNYFKKPRRIKYHGNYQKFIHFGFDDFMMLSSKKIIENKIVLLGYIGKPTGNNFDVEDKFFTPLNSKISGKSLPDTFGVTIHANIVKMLINDDFIRELSSFWIVLFTFILVYIFMIFYLVLERKGEIYNRTFKWITLFIFSAILIYIHLLFYTKNIYIQVFTIIAVVAIASNLFIFYVHLIKFLNKKYNWQSYLFSKS